MLNDGISIGAIVAVNLHDNHIISHFVFTVHTHLNIMMDNQYNRIVYLLVPIGWCRYDCDECHITIVII